MNKLSPKNKIFVALAVWLIISFIMFTYVFGITADSNTKILSEIADQKKTLSVLTAEQESYNQSRKDLDSMAKQPIQPSDFFSKDIALVKEIETLQNLGQNLGLTLALSGISGTVKSAAKANGLSGIVVVPYSIALQGPLPKVVNFIETLENLNFITNIKGISVSGGDGDSVNVNLTASLYLQM